MFFESIRRKNSRKSIAFARDEIFVASLRQTATLAAISKSHMTKQHAIRSHGALDSSCIELPHSSAILREQ